MTSAERGISRREFLLRLTAAGAGAAAGFASAELIRRVPSPFAEKPSLSLDFSSASLTPNLWNYEQGNQVAAYNNEAQTYTRRKENVRIEDGVLVIQARKEDLNDRHYTSARINTKGKFDIQYGKLVVEAKMPKGPGTWPAIWLRSTDAWNTNTAPEELRSDPNFWALNGEIDIAEGQGLRQGKIFSNIHTKESLDSKQNPYQGMIDVPDMSDVFHAYGVELTPGHIRFTLDGKPYHEIVQQKKDLASWPFDHTYHLVINLAMGGDWSDSLSKRLNSSHPNGIDDAQEKDWKLLVKSINYFPLASDLVKQKM